MLVLSRKKGEEIVITIDERTVRVRITGIQGDKVRLGISAPEEVAIYREEVWRRRAEFAQDAPTAEAANVS